MFVCVCPRLLAFACVCSRFRLCVCLCLSSKVCICLHLLAFAYAPLCRGPPFFKTVSEYCSARVSRVGLSTKQATEPYSDNLLNRTRNPSEPYSDKEIPLKRALRRFAFLVGFSTGNPPKIGTFTAWNRARKRSRTPSDSVCLCKIGYF